MTSRLNVLALSRQALAAALEAHGEAPSRIRPMLQHAHWGGERYADCPGIGWPTRARLEALFEITPPPVVEEQVASDGTVKWLMGAGKGAIETVFIPSHGRGTLCVSSQVGCALACTFCSTGRQGFDRNLSVAEILGQLRQARLRLKTIDPAGPGVTNVVFMGMGEPLLNYANVLKATQIMTDEWACTLSKRRVTISTSGVVPGIERMLADTEIALALSLHAPTDALRDVLVPINKTYPLARLMPAVIAYQKRIRRRIMVEYVCLEGVNDQPEHADALIRLLEDLPCKINLIPFNPFPGSGYRCSPRWVVKEFQERIHASHRPAIIRETRGEDIDAACGQLVGEVAARNQRRLVKIRNG